MSQLNTGGARPNRPAAESDIYTALSAISALALLLATIYVGYRANLAFGSLLPIAGG